RHAALLVGKDATITPFEPPATHRLAPTPWFRISRRTRTDNPAQTRVIKTFEDTPFYSRSLIETKLFGKVRRGVHESLSGNALKRLSTKIMLPFRMPRRPGPTR
ncbi:MAG: carotenoid 1,2-hydratase, partial [Pseudomonadota bacterium]